MHKWAYRFSAIAVIVLFSLAAHADTYQLFNIGSDNGYHFVGMDDLGDVVIKVIAPPELPVGEPSDADLYYIYSNGILTFVFYSATDPVFSADNGTPCTPSVPAGGFVLRGVCNNGRDAFTGQLSAGEDINEVYEGPSFTNIYPGPQSELIYMNSVGDIVFNDPTNEYWFFAEDLTTSTPEPGTLLLVGTGFLSVAGRIARRKLC
jgi:PEP-CTERM motif